MRRSMLVMLSVVVATASGCVAHDTAQSSQFARFSPAPVSDSPVLSIPAPPISTKSVGAVNRFVREHVNELQFCHAEAAMNNAAATGTAKLEVTLAEDGYVLRARIVERAWDGEATAMEECVLSNVRRWKFPDNDTFDQYIHTFTVSLGGEKATVVARR